MLRISFQENLMSLHSILEKILLTAACVSPTMPKEVTYLFCRHKESTIAFSAYRSLNLECTLHWVAQMSENWKRLCFPCPLLPHPVLLISMINTFFPCMLLQKTQDSSHPSLYPRYTNVSGRQYLALYSLRRYHLRHKCYLTTLRQGDKTTNNYLRSHISIYYKSLHSVVWSELLFSLCLSKHIFSTTTKKSTQKLPI